LHPLESAAFSRRTPKGDIELAVALIEQCLPYTLTLARIQLAN
jgi:hypothetical protein